MDPNSNSYAKKRIPRLNNRDPAHNYQIMSQLLSANLEPVAMETVTNESSATRSSLPEALRQTFGYLPPVNSDSISRTGVNPVHLSSSPSTSKDNAASSYNPGILSARATSLPTTLIKFRNENEVNTSVKSSGYPSFARIVSPVQATQVPPLQPSTYSMNNTGDSSILNDKGELKSSKEIIYTTKRIKQLRLNNPGKQPPKAAQTITEESSTAFINATVLSSPYIFQTNGSALIGSNQASSSCNKAPIQETAMFTPSLIHVGQSNAQILNRSVIYANPIPTQQNGGVFGNPEPKETNRNTSQSNLDIIGNYELDFVTGQLTYTYPISSSTSSSALQEIANQSSGICFASEVSKQVSETRLELQDATAAAKDLASRFICDTVNSADPSIAPVGHTNDDNVFHVTDSFINDLNNPVKSAAQTNQFIDLFTSNNESLLGNQQSAPSLVVIEQTLCNTPDPKDSNRSPADKDTPEAEESVQAVEEKKDAKPDTDQPLNGAVKHNLFSLIDSVTPKEHVDNEVIPDDTDQVRIPGYTIAFPNGCEFELISMLSCYVAVNELEDDIGEQLGIKLVCSLCQKRFQRVEELREHKLEDKWCKLKEKSLLPVEVEAKSIRIKDEAKQTSTAPLAENNIDYYLMTYTYDGSEPVDVPSEGGSEKKNEEAEYLVTLTSPSGCHDDQPNASSSKAPTDTYDLEKSLISQEVKQAVGKRLLDWNTGEDDQPAAKFHFKKSKKLRTKKTAKVSSYFTRSKKLKADLSPKDHETATEEDDDEEYGSDLDSEEIEAFDLDDEEDDDTESAFDDLETVNLSKSMLNAKNIVTEKKPKRRYRHADRSKGVQECEECKKTCRTKAEYLVHQHKHAGKTAECWECGKKCATFSNLISHVQIHTGEKPYSCKTCGKQFTQDAHLQRHLRLHTGERPFVCNICGKDYKDYSYYQTHMRIHRGQRDYKCEYCGKQYYDASYYKKHVRLHTGEKPYMCTVCGQQFHRSDYLKLHSYSHTKERPHTCHLCGRGFTMNYNLQIHIKKHSKPPKIKNKKNKKYVLTTVTIEDNFDDFDCDEADQLTVVRANTLESDVVDNSSGHYGTAESDETPPDLPSTSQGQEPIKSQSNFDSMISVAILNVDPANEQILKQFESVTGTTNLAEFNLNEIL